jgi:hypothetical protein
MKMWIAFWSLRNIQRRWILRPYAFSGALGVDERMGNGY